MDRGRRSVLGLPLLLAATAARAGLPEPLRVGMSTALSGPAQGLGNGMKAGVEAYFARVNAAGGIHGRPLELVALDDQDEPSETGPNVRRLIDSERVLAIVGNVGTPTAVVTVPIVNEKKVPLFGAFTEAGVLRKTPPDRYVFNVRSSYADETAEMIRGLLVDRKLRAEDDAMRIPLTVDGHARCKGSVASCRLGGGRCAYSKVVHLVQTRLLR